DPTLCIGVSMSVNAWKTNSRYNALHLSKKLVPIIQSLHDANLIDMAKGSYSAPGAKGNRTTRIRAAEIMQGWFAKAKFDREDIGRAEGEEVIILKDKNNKQIEYEDTPETDKMREEVLAYNELIASSFIDIPSLEDPTIEPVEEGDTYAIRVDGGPPRLRRIFSRSDWQMNGRFYGGWWQRINGDWRSQIFINDEPTVEVDFQGLHINLLYAEIAEELVGDPYDLSPIKFHAYPDEMVRNIVKRLVLTSLNAKDKSSAYKAFRNGFSNTHWAKQATDIQIDKFLNAFLARNPKISDYLFSDKGIQLMRIDSDITAHIHSHFTEQGIPVLSVHDSYIVEYRRVTELRVAMAKASEAVVGRALPTSIKLPDLSEHPDITDGMAKGQIQNREVVRCKGYLERRDKHGAWLKVE
ncbi:hypothetical protein AB9F29_21000, partial [Falsihalocynthiibacter sp. S25ZX9]|uniref:hypothetical protein n=1 Tax=Falsihalocynthiibacter sp. S25ZX9 TaxID=3240870 RepID=UPI00350F7E2D